MASLGDTIVGVREDDAGLLQVFLARLPSEPPVPQILNRIPLNEIHLSKKADPQ